MAKWPTTSPWTPGEWVIQSFPLGLCGCWQHVQKMYTISLSPRYLRTEDYSHTETTPCGDWLSCITNTLSFHSCLWLLHQSWGYPRRLSFHSLATPTQIHSLSCAGCTREETQARGYTTAEQFPFRFNNLKKLPSLKYSTCIASLTGEISDWQAANMGHAPLHTKNR